MVDSPTGALVQPLDEANRWLLAEVHPPDWRNPDPHPVYDLVVLGGGTAGLVCAVGAASLGARVALAERRLLGGDCLNVGCVPSKALLRSARAASEIRRGRGFGVAVDAPRIGFGAVMQRLRERRASIAINDSANRLARLGIHVFFGDAAFANERTVTVDQRVLRFRRAVIATGSRPATPPVRGLEAVPYLTNETLFSLTERPGHLVAIGAGPIGCEMAQAFARLGSRVTLFDAAPRVLPREDADAAAIVHRALERDGISLELGTRLLEVRSADGAIAIALERRGEPIRMITGDCLLVAAGREPDIHHLNLVAAGVESDAQGVIVDDRLRTTNPRVFASGDVCSTFKFTHAADAMSRIVIQNALFYGRRKASALVIPWCTYTAPEVAHVGLNENAARDRGRSVATITVELSDVDRAVVDDETEGFLRVHHEKGRLVGCTIVAPHAGDLIGQASFAMTRGARLSHFSSTVYPYPTIAEAFRKAGDTYRRTLVSAGFHKWLERYFRWTR
jgi:pyruvate/2-oxoglutarate dehydrogenase complex dihydrolipoamide dehydrogenase (E3) component